MKRPSHHRQPEITRVDQMDTIQPKRNDQSIRRYSWSAAALGAAIGLLIHLGAFKGTRPLIGLPIDPTLLLALVVLVLSLIATVGNRVTFPHLASPLLALWIVFLLGLPFIGSTIYAYQKVILLFTLCAGVAFVSFLMSERDEFVVALLWTQVLAGGLMAVLLGFYGGADNTQGRLILDGSSSIGAARVVGAAVVVLFTLSFGSRRRLLIHGLAILGLSTILIGIGSRGPFMFAALSSLAAARFSRWSQLNKPLRPLIWIFLLGGIVYYFAVNYQTRQLPLARVLLPINESLSADQSIGARLSLIRSSFSLIAQHPLGVGWGNFAQAARADGLGVYLRHAYPHNVLLEVGVEAGVLALAALALVMAASLRGLHRNSGTGPWASAFAMGIYSVGNALVSGDIASNRSMWCVIGLGIACWVRQSRSISMTAVRLSKSPGVGTQPELIVTPKLVGSRVWAGESRPSKLVSNGRGSISRGLRPPPRTPRLSGKRGC